MSQVVIENPIINSPFSEPTRHFKFTDEGITDEILDGRRISSYFVPIARPKKKGKQRSLFETEWTQDRIEENKLVNDIRRRIGTWRKGGYIGITLMPTRKDRQDGEILEGLPGSESMARRKRGVRNLGDPRAS